MITGWQQSESVFPRITSILLRLGVTGGLLSLGALLSDRHVFFDLLSHFRVQYIALILPLLVVALLGKRLVSGVILAVCVSVHLTAVYISYQRVSPGAPVQKSDRATNTLRVMSSNLLASNKSHNKQISFILSTDSDVIVFQEYTHTWDNVLSRSLTAFPHRITAPLNSPFGIAIYSRHALTDSAITRLFPGARPSATATVSIGGLDIEIFGTHPPPPMSAELYDERNRHLQHLAKYASGRSKPLVIAGDLNTSPWSASFQQLLNNGNLFDARARKGLYPTWPAFFTPLQIPIDYIIVSPHFTVTSMHTSNSLASDHKTVWATLEF